jgi:hypothetical protein
MESNTTVELTRVYQDTRNSSQLWRQNDRVFHPLTEAQFETGFKAGDRVTMELITPTDTLCADYTVAHITSYENAQAWMGSYSMVIDAPFTHVLVLKA